VDLSDFNMIRHTVTSGVFVRFRAPLPVLKDALWQRLQELPMEWVILV
jgi:hypothetical protein